MRTAEQFWANVEKGPGCWRWLAYTEPDGRGQLNWRGKTRRAHVVAYELGTGITVPTGLELLHSCDNGGCCNYGHMRPDTHAANLADMDAKGRRRPKARIAVCKNGHAMTNANSYVRRDRQGRECRQCRTEAANRYRERAADAVQTKGGK